MMSKTLTAAALVVGLIGVGANAAPKRTNDSAAREATRQLNEQQLASNSSMMQQPGTMPQSAPVPTTQVPVEQPGTQPAMPPEPTPPPAVGGQVPQ